MCCFHKCLAEPVQPCGLLIASFHLHSTRWQRLCTELLQLHLLLPGARWMVFQSEEVKGSIPRSQLAARQRNQWECAGIGKMLLRAAFSKGLCSPNCKQSVVSLTALLLPK